MTRSVHPFSAPDLSALARTLTKALAEHFVDHGRPPGHVEMMNLLARGVGQRNLQAWQAAAARHALHPLAGLSETAADAWFDAPALIDAAAPAPAQAPALSAHAKKALEHFDLAGRLERWPQKYSVQGLAMWVLWTRFDARRVYTEAQVNHVLKAWHLFGDHATLRRELINHRLLERKSDCSEYRKLVREPDDEVRSLLQALRAGARSRTRSRSRRPPRVLPAAGASPTP